MRRLIFWEFPRASWQYDLIVLVLLAFIFLTPRDLFRDQPRPVRVAMVPAEASTDVYFIDPSVLAHAAKDATDGEARKAQAAVLIEQQFKHRRTVVRVETLYDSENEVKGFLAYAKQ
jgi:hypothetical protein